MIRFATATLAGLLTILAGYWLSGQLLWLAIPGAYSVNMWNFTATGAHLALVFGQTVIVLVAGGIVAAFLTPKRGIETSAVVGMLYAGFGLSRILLSTDNFYPAWWKVTLVLTAVPEAFFGGVLVAQCRQRFARRAILGT